MPFTQQSGFGGREGTFQTCAGLQGRVKEPMYAYRLQVWGIRKLQVCMGEAASNVSGNPPAYPKGADTG